MVHQFICKPGTAEADTNKGRVRGYIYDNVYTFKGIPYAKAKRFHAPEPADAWEKTLNCTSYGYVCPLLEIGKPNGELNVPHRYWPMNENCQNLNVWTPGLDDKKRPVMVWFHGGGYEAGSAIEQNVYEGGNMAAIGDVVVVSVNHRLNILGYMDLSAFGEEYENSGNAGSADLIASLQWVHDNIAAFGGNPENVCIFGQSGGGAKVTTMLQSPEADGLYAKGINISGVTGPILPDQKGSGEELVKAIMAELKLENVKELETVSYDAFAGAYRKLKPQFAAAGKYVGCTPLPNSHYAGDPCAVGFRKETAAVPLMVGSVFGEFFAFAPLQGDRSNEEEAKSVIRATLGDAAENLIPMFKEAYPERPLYDLLKLDILFRGPEMPYTTMRSGLNRATWVYLFNEDSQIEGGNPPWHCSDLPYVFHNCEMAPATQQEGVEELEDKIFSTVMAFARTGDPNNEKIPYWAPSTPEEEHVLVVDSKNTRCATNFDRKLVPAFGAVMGPIMQKMMAAMMENVQH